VKGANNAEIRMTEPKHPSSSLTLRIFVPLVLVAILLIAFHLIGAVDLSDAAFSSSMVALATSLVTVVLRPTSRTGSRGRAATGPLLRVSASGSRSSS
jgi:hypothetical protein